MSGALSFFQIHHHSHTKYACAVHNEHKGLMPLPLERIGRLRTQIARGLRSSLCTAGLTLLACGALTVDCKATPPTRPLLDVPWWLLLWNMISNLYHIWLHSLPQYDLTSSIEFRCNSLLVTTSKSFTYNSYFVRSASMIRILFWASIQQTRFRTLTLNKTWMQIFHAVSKIFNKNSRAHRN